jgi:hypothetical protein
MHCTTHPTKPPTPVGKRRRRRRPEQYTVYGTNLLVARGRLKKLHVAHDMSIHMRNVPHDCMYFIS